MGLRIDLRRAARFGKGAWPIDSATGTASKSIAWLHSLETDRIDASPQGNGTKEALPHHPSGTLLGHVTEVIVPKRHYLSCSRVRASEKILGGLESAYPKFSGVVRQGTRILRDGQGIASAKFALSSI